MFYKDVIADWTNFVFAFGRDAELFYRWYQLWLWQSLHGRCFGEPLGRSKEVLLLWRLLTVLHGSSPEDASAREALVQDQRLAKLADFIDSLFSREEGSNPLVEWIANCRTQVDFLYAGVHPNGDRREAQISQMMKTLGEGNVCEYSGPQDDVEARYSRRDSSGMESSAGPCRHITNLFAAYLRLFAEMIAKPGRCIDRDPETGEPVVPAGAEPGYFVDSRGGSFINDPAWMRKVYMWRAAFLVSLWDFSCKMKAQFWKKRLSSRPS